MQSPPAATASQAASAVSCSHAAADSSVERSGSPSIHPTASAGRPAIQPPQAVVSSGPMPPGVKRMGFGAAAALAGGGAILKGVEAAASDRFKGAITATLGVTAAAVGGYAAYKGHRAYVAVAARKRAPYVPSVAKTGPFAGEARSIDNHNAKVLVQTSTGTSEKVGGQDLPSATGRPPWSRRSEEHTSELQSL